VIVANRRSNADSPTGSQVDRQYRKRGAAGPRPGWRCGILRRDNLNPAESNRLCAYAEKNVQASLDYAQSLLKARDLTEVMRLHAEYVQGQMRSLTEQASEMGQIVHRAAMEAVKPKM
jgi:hypothetical protein